MSFGTLFLSAALSEGSVGDFLQYGSIDHLFVGSEIEPYAFIRDFIRKHHALPKAPTVAVSTGTALPAQPPEPASYYLDCLKERHIETSLKTAVTDAGAFLKLNNKHPRRALEVFAKAVMNLSAQEHGQQVVDFRDAYETVLGEYVAKHQKGDDYGLHLGWPYFDKMSGGLVRGDLTSFVGRPQKGKTWQMLYAALHGWNKEGAAALEAAKAKKELPAFEQSRLFVSMEMHTGPIQQRMAAMQSKIDAKHLKHASLSTKDLNKLKGALTTIKGYGAPFWVVDGNLTATVEDIYNMARQLKPGAIFIDGAYLIKHPTERDRYRRVAENAELIKTMLCPLAPTVASWQFAKPPKKKKADAAADKQGLDDIGYTDAIAQVSSIVIALLEEDNVETLARRLNEVLKGRGGETGRFFTRWDFQAMDFTEVKEVNVEDLSYV